MKYLFAFVFLFLTVSAAFAAPSVQPIYVINRDSNPDYYILCPDGTKVGKQLMIQYPYIIKYGMVLNPTEQIYQLQFHGYIGDTKLIGADFLLVCDIQGQMYNVAGYEVDPHTHSAYYFQNLGGQDIGTP